MSHRWRQEEIVNIRIEHWWDPLKDTTVGGKLIFFFSDGRVINGLSCCWLCWIPWSGWVGGERKLRVRLIPGVSAYCCSKGTWSWSIGDPRLPRFSINVPLVKGGKEKEYRVRERCVIDLVKKISDVPTYLCIPMSRFPFVCFFLKRIYKWSLIGIKNRFAKYRCFRAVHKTRKTTSSCIETT